MSKIDLGITLPELAQGKEDTRLEVLLKKVAKEHGVSAFKLKTGSRKHNLVAARADFAKRALKLKPKPILEELGDVLNKHHSTIIHYVHHYV